MCSDSDQSGSDKYDKSHMTRKNKHFPSEGVQAGSKDKADGKACARIKQRQKF
jgi:hypothetical protein